MCIALKNADGVLTSRAPAENKGHFYTLPLSLFCIGVINILRIGLKFNLLLIKKTQPNNKI